MRRGWISFACGCARPKRTSVWPRTWWQRAAAIPPAIAFHSQQAAEKLLKGLLTMHQVNFPKTHNLGEPLDLVATIDTALAVTLREITALNPYGVEYRYPGHFPELAQGDAESALRLAEKTRAVVMPMISEALESD